MVIMWSCGVNTKEVFSPDIMTGEISTIFCNFGNYWIMVLIGYVCVKEGPEEICNRLVYSKQIKQYFNQDVT